MSSIGARSVRAKSGVPQSGQKERVMAEPEAAMQEWPLVAPSIVTVSAGMRTTAECPVPVALRQSRHEQTSIESTGPETVTVTAPHAQRAVSLRTRRVMAGGWHGARGKPRAKL